VFQTASYQLYFLPPDSRKCVFPEDTAKLQLLTLLSLNIWMRRWLETHRALKALREAFADLRQRPLDHYQQLGLGFANTLCA
jgi:hypothetical protein